MVKTAFIVFNRKMFVEVQLVAITKNIQTKFSILSYKFIIVNNNEFRSKIRLSYYNCKFK